MLSLLYSISCLRKLQGFEKLVEELYSHFVKEWRKEDARQHLHPEIETETETEKENENERNGSKKDSDRLEGEMKDAWMRQQIQMRD